MLQQALDSVYAGPSSPVEREKHVCRILSSINLIFYTDIQQKAGRAGEIKTHGSGFDLPVGLISAQTQSADRSTATSADCSLHATNQWSLNVTFTPTFSSSLQLVQTFP